MAPEQESEGDLLEGLDHREMEMLTLMHNALALCHSGQVHRKGPKSYSSLKAMESDALEDQQQNSYIAQIEKGWLKDKAIPVAPVKLTGDGNHGGAQKGSCSRSANCAIQHDDQCRAKGKETSGCGHQVERKDSPLRSQKSVPGQAQVDFLVSVARKIAV